MYDSNKYGKNSQYGNTQYETLCTYIRNAIDHPDSGNTYTKEELRSVRIVNQGSGRIVIEKAASACLDFLCGDYDMIRFYGGQMLWYGVCVQRQFFL